jgi:hypothetical protein
MLIAVSLLKQPRDGVMGCAAKCERADGSVELPEAVIVEYPEARPARPIPQIPYVETGNAGERGLQVFEPGARRRVARGSRTAVVESWKRKDRTKTESRSRGPGKLGRSMLRPYIPLHSPHSPTFLVAKNEEARGAGPLGVEF